MEEVQEVQCPASEEDQEVRWAWGLMEEGREDLAALEEAEDPAAACPDSEGLEGLAILEARRWEEGSLEGRCQGFKDLVEEVEVVAACPDFKAGRWEAEEVPAAVEEEEGRWVLVVEDPSTAASSAS